MAEVEKTETPEEENQEATGEENPEGATEGAEGEAGAEGEEGEAPPPNKKKKMILIGLVVVILIAGIGTFFMLKGKKDEENAAKEAEAAETAEDQVIFHDLEDMIINLNTGGKNVSFMKLKVTVELGDSDSLAQLEKMMPKIIDVFQMYLRELRPQDMQGSVGLYRLKEELILRINKIIMPGKVNDLLFKEVLVQ